MIKNKYNRILWELDYPAGGDYIEKMKWPYALETTFRILDVNRDGKNEVLFRYTSNSQYSISTVSEGLALFNYKGQILWRRGFSKELFSKREYLTPPYPVSIYDTLTINHNLCILCGSNNVNSYASAVYVLDLANNKIVSDTLWSSGHISDARVVELKNDGIRHLVILSCNNSYQRNCLSHLLLIDMKGQLPASDDYKLFNIEPAKLLDCFLIPNSDFALKSGLRMNGILLRSAFINYEAKLIRFHVLEAGSDNSGLTIYNWYYNTNNFDISISNDFRVMWDSLVAHGKLPLLYTDTKEYREKLRKQILAWDGEKFIPLDEYRVKKAAQK